MSEQDESERGVSMIELIVGMGMATVVAVLALYVLTTTFKTQSVVTGSTKGATQGQAISAIIDKAVRTAAYVQPSGDRLDVHLAGGGCLAFAVVTDADGTTNLREKNTGTSDAKITAAVSTWPVMAAGISHTKAAGVDQPYFKLPSGASAGTGVTYGFTLQRGSGPVIVSGTTFERVSGGAISPCV